MSTALSTPTSRGHRPDGVLTGAAVLARAYARRTRWFWLVWLLVLASVFPATAKAYRTSIPEGPAGVAMADRLGGLTAMRAILGPPFDLLHVGPFVMWRVGTFMIATAGIMAILGVVRGTRAEEEDGRLELLRSGCVGRHAPLAATLSVTLGACAVLGLLVLAGMAGPSGDARGTVVMACGVALGAAVWAGVAAVAAQLTESARAARGIALSALGAAYLVRATGDAPDPTVPALQWLSPLDWPALARPYTADRWWVLLLPALLTAGLVATAFALEARRDHGAGLRPARLGPADASPGLRDVASLVRRLDRTTVVGWAVGLVLFAVCMGTLAGSIGSVLADDASITDRFRRMGAGGSDLTQAFDVAMIGIVVPLVALLGLQLVGVLRREEERGHVELLLSTATSRTRLLAAHLVPALVVPTALLALIGAGMSLPAVLAGHDIGPAATLTGATLAMAPGIWLVVGLAAAVHAWAPRLGVVPWLVVGWSLAAAWLGAAVELPEAVVRFTPFARLPRLPVETMTWTAVVIETALAVVLLTLAVVGYRRRDLTTG